MKKYQIILLLIFSFIQLYNAEDNKNYYNYTNLNMTNNTNITIINYNNNTYLNYTNINANKSLENTNQEKKTIKKIENQNKKITEQNKQSNKTIDNNNIKNNTNKQKYYNSSKLLNTTNNETLSEGIGKVINNPRQPLPIPITNKLQLIQKSNINKKLRSINKHSSNSFFPFFIFILMCFLITLIFYLEYKQKIKNFYYNIIPLKEAFE